MTVLIDSSFLLATDVRISVCLNAAWNWDMWITNRRNMNWQRSLTSFDGVFCFSQSETKLQFVFLINLEKEMATLPNILTWEIPWTEEPDRLQSLGSQRVGHDWAISLSLEPKKIKSATVSTFSLSIWHEVMGPGAMILVFRCWILSFFTLFFHSHQ